MARDTSSCSSYLNVGSGSGPYRSGGYAHAHAHNAAKRGASGWEMFEDAHSGRMSAALSSSTPNLTAASAYSLYKL